MFKKLISFGLTLALLGGFALFSGLGAARADGHTQRFIVSVDNVGQFPYKFLSVFNTPVGESAPGPLLPGNSYQTTVYGDPGDYVSFATMFVQSNDLFYAPNELGIPLYDEAGNPRSGDVTAEVALWDAGTEFDEPLGDGAAQAPRQAGPDTGAADPNNFVRHILSGDLNPRDYIQVTLNPQGNGRFLLTVGNISSDATYPTPLAPGVAVVHSAPAPLFINGQADFGAGLAALAEDGNPGPLANSLRAHTGINTPLAPVGWAVHTAPNALFTSGAPASVGLERLAEDGGPGALVDSVSVENKGAATVGRGASGPGPIFAPSGNYSFEIVAAPGDHISLATMFVQSNDWFFGLNNLPLFDAAGNPRSGNVTHHVRLYDAGSEVDQTPGFGANQAPRQAGPNTGPSQGGVVTPVTDSNFSNIAGNIHITITPVE